MDLMFCVFHRVTAWVISEALSDLQCWNHVTHGVVAFQTEFRVAICHQQPQSLPFDRTLTNYTNPILSFVLFRLRLVEDGSQQYNLQPTSMEAAYCSFPSGTSSQHVDDFFVETSMPPN